MRPRVIRESSEACPIFIRSASDRFTTCQDEHQAARLNPNPASSRPAASSREIGASQAVDLPPYSASFRQFPPPVLMQLLAAFCTLASQFVAEEPRSHRKVMTPQVHFRLFRGWIFHRTDIARWRFSWAFHAGVVSQRRRWLIQAELDESTIALTMLMKWSVPSRTAGAQTRRLHHRAGVASAGLPAA